MSQNGTHREVSPKTARVLVTINYMLLKFLTKGRTKTTTGYRHNGSLIVHSVKDLGNKRAHHQKGVTSHTYKHDITIQESGSWDS